MRKQGDYLIDNGVLIEYTGTDAEVAVPEGIKEIGFEAFYRKNVVSVSLPKGLRRIGRLAFNKCEKLAGQRPYRHRLRRRLGRPPRLPVP
jgi:hypothetical protein